MSFDLGALLRGVDGVAFAGGAAAAGVRVDDVRDDSRAVRAGDLFVAVPGTAADGRRFVADAAARGATVLVTEPPAPAFAGLVVTVPSARHALGVIAANRFGAARALSLTAVTGTNGKTTTTYLVESMLRAAGRGVGVIGTVNYRTSIPDATPVVRPAPLTTPGALALHGLLADMRAAGATDVVLEASSHALEQGRLDGCRFRVAALTNVTQDHLDFHGTMDRYFDAKAILFERLLDPARGVSVLFVDKEEGVRMRARCKGPTLGVARQPGTPGADVVAELVVLDDRGTRVTFATPLGPIKVSSPLVGDFNLENLALAVGMGVAADLPLAAIEAGLWGLTGVPGRLERVANDRDVLCVVDYAHTPDALARAIVAMRPYARGRLIVVFGCGGDRDRGKRPLMGQVAARGADLSIVTSDNPRTEDPDAIIDMIVPGLEEAGATPLTAAQAMSWIRPRGAMGRNYTRQPDRRAAIALATAMAIPGDVLLIAGKGHEDYQIVGATKAHFDDREEAAAGFARTRARAEDA
jgi:UDP-N-acetylmuramoyl-L-alanyl-D-glutamate--2,6-diaminopimelate ligase